MADKTKFKQIADELRIERVTSVLQIVQDHLNIGEWDAAEREFDLLLQDLKRLNFAKEIADK